MLYLALTWLPRSGNYLSANREQIDPRKESERLKASVSSANKLKILLCFAKHPPPSNQSNQLEQPANSTSASDGPTVIFLPPIYNESEQTQEDESGRVDWTDEDSLMEMEESEGHIGQDDEISRSAGGRRSRFGQQRAGKIWAQLMRQLGFVRRDGVVNGEHQDIGLLAKRAALFRVKRQARAGDPLDEATPDVLERPQTGLQDLPRQILTSLLLLIQQTMRLLLTQTVDNIPTHMANFGLLLANVLRVLTVENPLLTNSPALLRSQQASVQAKPIEAPSVASARERALMLETMLKLLGAFLRPQTNSTVGSRARANRTVIAKANTDERDEIQFVNQLNEMTLGLFKGLNGTSIGSERASRGGRSKRSIGSLVLFGPFSKFYMAMALNRLIKYQSGVLSQAVMSELVKRFVVPSVGAAFTSPFGLSTALNQVKQSMGALQSAVANPTQMEISSPSDLRASVGRAPENATLVQRGAQNLSDARANLSAANTNRLVSDLQQPLNSDCQFVGPLASDLVAPDNRQVISTDSTMSLLATALGQQPISVDQNGISINLPNSQTSVTIPSVQSSFREMLKLISPKDFHEPESPSQNLQPTLALELANRRGRLLDFTLDGGPSRSRFRHEPRKMSPHPFNGSTSHKTLHSASPYDWMGENNLEPARSLANQALNSYAPGAADLSNAANLMQGQVGDQQKQIASLLLQLISGKSNGEQWEEFGVNALNASAANKSLDKSAASELRDKVINATLERTLSYLMAKTFNLERELENKRPPGESLSLSPSNLLGEANFEATSANSSSADINQEPYAASAESPPIQVVLSADNAITLLRKLISLARSTSEPTSRDQNEAIRMGPTLFEREKSLAQNANALDSKGTPLKQNAVNPTDSSRRKAKAGASQTGADHRKKATSPLRIMGAAVEMGAKVQSGQRVSLVQQDLASKLKPPPPNGQVARPRLPRPLRSEDSQPGSSLDRQSELRKTQPNSLLQNPQPLTKGQSEHEHPKLVEKTSSSEASQVQPSGPLWSHRSEFATTSEQADLNNLAMALNVMNLALLNQKLATNNLSSSADSRRGIQTTNFHVVHHRVGQPRGAGNFVPKLRLKGKAGRQRERLNGAKSELPHHLYVQAETPSAWPPIETTKAPADQLEREGTPPPARASNHRTGWNRIQANSTLRIDQSALLAKSREEASKQPASYRFQPLTVTGGGIGMGLGAETEGSTQTQAGATSPLVGQPQMPDGPESDHATRWNDVLRHLNLAA